jgi:hypothetical protein
MNFKEFFSRQLHSGIQYLEFFPNGYGVSIVNHEFSYKSDSGDWELAVVIGDKDKYELTYDTPITDNVLGSLSENEVNDICIKVSELPER